MIIFIVVQMVIHVMLNIQDVKKDLKNLMMLYVLVVCSEIFFILYLFLNELFLGEMSCADG